MRIYSSPSHLSFMNVSAGWEGAVLCCVCRPVKTRAWRAFAPERTSDHTTTDRIWPEKLRFNILHWKMVSAPFYISPLTYKTGHACSHILIIAPPNAGRCYCFLKGHVSESPAGCLKLPGLTAPDKNLNVGGRFFVHATREITFQSGTQWQTISLWVPVKVPASLESERKCKTKRFDWSAVRRVEAWTPRVSPSWAPPKHLRPL